MLASEIIAQLTTLMARYGDRQVLFADDNLAVDIGSVRIYSDPFDLNTLVYLLTPPSYIAPSLDTELSS